jgi:hypothetical protein
VIDTISAQYYTLRMAMGKRKRLRLPALWVTTTDLPTAASHPFYRRLGRGRHGHNSTDASRGRAEQLEAVAAVTVSVAVIEEVVADKGYHSRTMARDLETLAIRTYISEPDRGPQASTPSNARWLG